MHSSKFWFGLLPVLAVLVFPGMLAAQSSGISLQQLLEAMKTNYEGLKSQGSLVQQKQAQQKATAYNRLPHLNTYLQATVGSDNNLDGDFLSYGSAPSLESGERVKNNLSAVSGDMAVAGVNWEAINFGQYKAQNDVAKSDLALQISSLAKTQYDLNGVASACYLELLRQYHLQLIQQDNVTRLKDLLAGIAVLVSSGTRPMVDSMVAVSELSKATAALYDAQSNYAQTQVQLSTLTGLAAGKFIPDTTDEQKLIDGGTDYFATANIDTLHHPQIQFYNSLYEANNARLNLEKKRYFPKVYLDVDAWERGSSLNNSDVFNPNLAAGYAPSRFNYFAGLTLSYDIFNIVRKKLNLPTARFGAESAYHDLLNQKENLNGQMQQAFISKSFQARKLKEVNNELEAASAAYDLQLNLYNTGLSSIIELNIALDYYIRAQKDQTDARISLLKSILNYSLVTNSFTGLVQNLKL